MNPLDRLSEYLRDRRAAVARAGVDAGRGHCRGRGMVATVILVLIANSFAFSPTSLLASRTLLFLALALALGAGLVVPLLRLNAGARRARRSRNFPNSSSAC